MSPVNRSASPSASGKKAGSTLSTHKGIRKHAVAEAFLSYAKAYGESMWKLPGMR